MSGLIDTTASSPLPSATVDELAKQAIPQYATAAARDADAVLTAALREGLTVYLLDVNAWSVYTGSGWSTVGPVHGALTGWTCAVVQGGSVTVNQTEGATYRRVGRDIKGKFYVTATGGGTPAAANNITVSLPVAAVSANGTIGTFAMVDASTGLLFHGVLVLATTTTAYLARAASESATVATAYLGNGGFTVALAINDSIQGSFSYETAADA